MYMNRTPVLLVGSVVFFCLVFAMSIDRLTGKDVEQEEQLIAIDWVGDWDYDIIASDGWIYCYAPEKLLTQAKKETEKFVSDISASMALSNFVKDGFEEAFAKVGEDKYKIILQLEKDLMVKVNNQKYTVSIKDAPRTVVFTRPKPIYEKEIQRISIGH